MTLVDAHCHFDFPVFDAGRDSLWTRAHDQGIRGLVIPGVRKADWARVSALADPARGIWYCLGIHPWFIDEHRWEDLDLLESMLDRRPSGCLALGECGLDGLKGGLNHQTDWFRAQVGIAQRLGLPLVIHSVKTHDQVHGLLRAERWQGRALVHGFSGSYEQAMKLVELGCVIGVGGVITHERARKTRDAIARLPASALVLETDAPDMAPAGVAKGENSPLELPGILAALAEVRGEPAGDLAQTLLENVARLYGVASEVLAPGAGNSERIGE
ncbi:MAG: TatD family hydrolase [Pseudomonadota bacterium]|nr:TatD family hydrolase [Pseudomonadota bacterium]